MNQNYNKHTILFCRLKNKMYILVINYKLLSIVKYYYITRLLIDYL